MKKIAELKRVSVSVVAVVGTGLMLNVASIQAKAKDLQKGNDTIKTEILNEAKKSLGSVLYPLKVLSERKLTDDTYFTIIEFNTPMGRRDLPVVVIRKKGVVVGGYFENGVNISAQVMRKVRAKEIKTGFSLVKGDIQKSVMAKYTPNGKIRGRLYVFVDPLCPFCENAEAKLKGWADKYKYEIYLVPFIIHGKRAKELTQAFICNNKSFDDYVNKNYGAVSPNGCAKAEKILKNAYAVERKLGLAGTPTFITEKGNVVEGINYPKIKRLMSEGK